MHRCTLPSPCSLEQSNLYGRVDYRITCKNGQTERERERGRNILHIRSSKRDHRHHERRAAGRSALKYEYSRDTQPLPPLPWSYVYLSISLGEAKTECGLNSMHKRSRYDTNANMLHTQTWVVTRAGHERPLAFALICVSGSGGGGGGAIRISNQESVISR